MEEQRSAHEEWKRDAAVERTKSCEALRAELEQMEATANSHIAESLRELQDKVACTTSDYNQIKSEIAAADVRISELASKEERMRYSLQCMEAEVQAAEDRCAQLQHLCAEVKGQLDELGETKARKQAELAAADSRLQSVQSLVLAENAKLLASQSAILCPVSRAASHRRIPLFRDWRAGWLTLLCFALARRNGRGAQSSRTRKARAEPGGRLSEDK